MDLGLNILNIRKHSKLTSKEFASKLGISQSYLSEIENGKKTPTIEVVQKIAKELNMTVSELLGETPEQLSPELRQLLDEAKDLTPEQLEQLTKFLKTMK